MKYADVESGLAELYSISGEALSKFKSRIKHFQRIDLVISAPGKGKKIEYDLNHIVQWVFCFEFAEFGLTPELIKALFLRCGPTFYQGLRDNLAYENNEEQIFFVSASFLEWSFSQGKHLTSEGSMAYGIRPTSKIGNAFEFGASCRRIAAINLTYLSCRIKQVFDVTVEFSNPDRPHEKTFHVSRRVSR